MEKILIVINKELKKIPDRKYREQVAIGGRKILRNRIIVSWVLRTWDRNYTVKSNDRATMLLTITNNQQTTTSSKQPKH
jgi:hypothetical protein